MLGSRGRVLIWFYDVDLIVVGCWGWGWLGLVVGLWKKIGGGSEIVSGV